MIEKIAGCSGHDCDWPTCAGCSRKEPTEIYVCDKCREEVDELYEFNDKEFCKDCIWNELIDAEVVEYLEDEFLMEYDGKYYDIEEELLDILVANNIIRRIT